ncbi:hypothetical protein [Kitasatospora sp. HPMI-4]|uniref:hypothetical protein n=1 Tax=Kitasatospora sp. HPMI-4 TaxID=3448443 RepID=UPI003F1A02D8
MVSTMGWFAGQVADVPVEPVAVRVQDLLDVGEARPEGDRGRALLRANDVPQEEVDVLAEELVALLPELLAERTEELRSTGQMMPGAREALAAAHGAEDLLPTVVTGNLQGRAEIKLRAFGLADFVDLSIGGYASDDSYRPALVAVAQQRAASKHGGAFHRKISSPVRRS